MPTTIPVPPVPIPRAVQQALADLAAAQGAQPLGCVLYPAGALTQALVQRGLPAGLALLGLGDARPNPSTRIQGWPVLASAELATLTPRAVLVASSRYHLEILQEHGQGWRAQGLQVIDLCADLGPLSELEDEAWRLGLELDQPDPGRLRITQPGPVPKRILYRREAWSNTLWMLRDFQHYFAGIESEPDGQGGLQVDLSRPGYHTLLPSTVRLFYPSMVEHEDLIAQYLDFARLEPGQAVLDLGAYAGDSSFFFARAVGAQGRVVAVEPDPSNLAALRRNVLEHGLTQVTVEPSAVLDRDGSIAFQAEGSIGSGIQEASSQTGFELEVATVTLDTLLARHQVPRPHFIKMDIEGAEVRVLAGHADLLTRLKPRMIIEPHPYRGVSNLAQILQILAGMGCASEVRDDLVRAWWP